jgi:hypothetical protein
VAWSNASTIMREYFETHPLHGFPFKIDPELVEVGFSYPLTAPDFCACEHHLSAHVGGGGRCEHTGCRCPRALIIIHCGRLDAITEDRQSGHLYVFETKTTGQISSTWLRNYTMDSQLSSYVWAAQQHVGVENVVGAYLNAIEFSRLPSDERKTCKMHGVKYAECSPHHAKFLCPIETRSPEMIERWRRGAIALARKHWQLMRAYPTVDFIDLPRQQGQWHRGCAFCEFYDFCRVGRPRNMVTSMLVESKWEPYARSQAAGGA